MTESSLRDTLAGNLSIIEPYLKLIKKEYQIKNSVGSEGFVDILATDSLGNFVIVEIKKSKASSRETMQEILKYVGLLKRELKVKDSEIRVIIVSTHWGELLVPFSEACLQTTLSITGYKLNVDDIGAILNTERIKPIDLPTVRRGLASQHLANLYITSEKQTKHLKSLLKKMTDLGLQDFVITQMSHLAPSGVPYPYANYIAFNDLETDKYENILIQAGELDMTKDEFDSEMEYRDYLADSILSAGKLTEGSDTAECGNPAFFNNQLVSGKWKIDKIIRKGIYEHDPRLSDEMIIDDLKGLLGTSEILFRAIGDTVQPDRIREILKSCFKPFERFITWRNQVEAVLTFAQRKGRPFRIAISVFADSSIYMSIAYFVVKNDVDYLPQYSIFLDFYEDGESYFFQGGLEWNGKPFSQERLDRLLADENIDAGYFIFVLNGNYDAEMMNVLEIEFQSNVEVFCKDLPPVLYSVSIDASDLHFESFHTNRMSEWRSSQKELIEFMKSSLDQGYFSN